MERPPLYSIVDRLYSGAPSILPEATKSNTKTAAAVASTLGVVGSAIATSLGQLTVKYAAGEDSSFYNTGLPIIEAATTAAVFAATAFYVKKHGGLEKMLKNYPVYTPGMLSVTAGSFRAVLPDIVRLAYELAK